MDWHLIEIRRFYIMDEKAKQMALQHIEEGEYKQAFAILDDFQGDMKAPKSCRLMDRLFDTQYNVK